MFVLAVLLGELLSLHTYQKYMQLVVVTCNLCSDIICSVE